MFIYYILIALVIILRVLLPGYKNNKIYLFICFFILLMVSGLRGYMVGGDLEYYIPLFKEISRSSISKLFTTYDKYGFFFKIYLYLCSIISSHSTFFLFCESALILSLIFYFIRFSSKDYVLSLFLFITLGYYTNTFNSIRSSFALSIAAVGVLDLIRNNKKLALLLFIIAFEIHKTILPIFIVLFIKDFKLNLLKMTIILGSSFLIITYLGINVLGPIILFYNEGYATVDSFEGAGYGLLLMDILMTLFCYLLIGKDNNNRNNQILLFLMFMGTCLQTLAPIFSFATRISYFFMFYAIILIPNVIRERFHTMNLKIVYLSTIIVGLIFFKITIMTPKLSMNNSNSQNTLPYYYYWESQNKQYE